MRKPVYDFLSEPHPLLIHTDVVEDTEEEEGFEPNPYRCTEGKLTIGFGTLLEHGISEDLAEIMLIYAMHKNLKQLDKRAPLSLITDVPQEIAEVLASMAYQMGVDGLMKFRNMWQALVDRDYNRAADEMLDSRWAKQTPNRANRHAEVVRSFA